MPIPDVDALLPLKPAYFHILLTLVEGPMHGYAVKRAVEDRTAGVIRLAAGSLYEGIQRLEANGLVEECPPPRDSETTPGKRWRFYTITGFGRDVLEADLVRLETDVAAARAKMPVEAPK